MAIKLEFRDRDGKETSGEFITERVALAYLRSLINHALPDRCDTEALVQRAKAAGPTGVTISHGCEDFTFFSLEYINEQVN